MEEIGSFGGLELGIVDHFKSGWLAVSLGSTRRDNTSLKELHCVSLLSSLLSIRLLLALRRGILKATCSRWCGHDTPAIVLAEESLFEAAIILLVA